jgi:hypothetical protein
MCVSNEPCIFHKRAICNAFIREPLTRARLRHFLMCFEREQQISTEHESSAMIEGAADLTVIQESRNRLLDQEKVEENMGDEVKSGISKMKRDILLELEQLDAHISAEAATHSRFSFPEQMPPVQLVQLDKKRYESSSLASEGARGLLLRNLLSDKRPISISEEKREDAGIPPKAEQFRFCYPAFHSMEVSESAQRLAEIGDSPGLQMLTMIVSSNYTATDSSRS